MLYIISAVCKSSLSPTGMGIGYENTIPWVLKSDLLVFKNRTKGNIIVMGANTYKSIGKLLPDRTNVILSNSLDIEGAIMMKNLTVLDEYINKMLEQKKDIYIIGGQKLYEYYIKDSRMSTLFITEIDKNFKCDTFFPVIPSYFKITQCNNYFEPMKYSFLKYDKVLPNVTEEEYLNLGQKILTDGYQRNDRTGTGTVSIFGHQMRFDISNSVPLLTTKKVPYKTCIEELLWFLRGETDAKILQNKGIKIWDGNTSREFLDNLGFNDVPTGELRFGYGHQIRRFGPNKVDQLEYVENLLKTDPFSRRIMWNLWNASDLKEMVLTPCFTKGSLVITETGYVPIEEIKEGDSVYTHKGEYRKCLNTQTSMYTDKIFHIKLRNNPVDITCTKEHLFYVCDKDNLSMKYWIEARNLNQRQHMLCLKTNDKKRFIRIDVITMKGEEKQYIIKDNSSWFLLGFLWENFKILEGNLIEFSIETNAVLNEVVEYLKDFKYIKEIRDKFIIVTLECDSVASILKNCTQEIPECFHNLSPEYLLYFLKGYKMCNKGNVFSKKNVLHLQRLYSKCGIETYVKQIQDNKFLVIETGASAQCSSPDQRYIYYSIEDINAIKYSSGIEVFNLEIEDHNTYTISNTIVHNCHNQVQFYVREKENVKYLSAQLYCRSSDYFLGLPFNIFSYVCLVYLLAKRCDLLPDELVITLGDAHIYKNHIDQVKELISRQQRSLPVLKINDSVKTKDYNDITIDDFVVSGYFPDKTIKGDMAI